MNEQKQWPTFKAGDEVFNLRMREWDVLINNGEDKIFPFIGNHGSFTLDGKTMRSNLFPSIFTYNPFDPFDPKNRDMPEWMQEYVNGKKDVHDMDVVDIPTDLYEIKRKIYAREMAIENDDKEALKKIVKVLWPNDKCLVSGNSSFYYQELSFKDKWNWSNTNPFISSILATELLRLIENNTMPKTPITPSHYKQPDPFEIAEIYGVNPPIADAVKYILRAGNKDASKYIEDLQKAIKCIQREVELSNKYRGGKK